MIGYLSTRGSKPTAWILFFIFYFEFAGLAYSHERNNYFKDAVPAIAALSYPALPKVSAAGFPLMADHENKAAVNKTDKKVAIPAVAARLQQAKFIGGPNQPEMNSFKSVGANNMVNTFTGDFSYNIPLLDVGGYPLNLFYNAGISMDQEASWVGLGWNLNPGTVSRNMRGLPDDFDGSAADGDQIIKTQSMKTDMTVGVNVGLNAEIAGHPNAAGVHAGIFWNNKKGLSMEVGNDFSIQASMFKNGGTNKTPPSDALSLTAGISLNSQSGLSRNIGVEAGILNQEQKHNVGLGASLDYNSRSGLEELKIGDVQSLHNKAGGSYINSKISFARPSYTPTIRMPLTRINGNLKIKIGTEFIIEHSNGYIAGSISNTKIDDDDRMQAKPAYGYMYYEDADGNDNALMDFNRTNDGTYTSKTPVISVPGYTYDLFTINGEGTGGTFRGYRGNMGYVHDNLTESKDGSLSLAFDAGGGNLFHGGVEIGGVSSKTKTGDWVKNNYIRNNIKFDKADGRYVNFYFKNPAEMSIIDNDYYNAVGGDRLVRPKLSDPGAPLPTAASAFETFDDQKHYVSDALLTSTNTRKAQPDKRTQIITYLTAEQAQRVGLDKQIISYSENEFNPLSCSGSYRTAIKRYNAGDPNYYRKAHHISEVDVLEGDGKRYVFGIPAYSVKQKDVTFSIAAGEGDPVTQLATYQLDMENSINNMSGRDHFYQSEQTNGYAHAFLLTAILSPDYVDIKGDGITDDDIGTAIKFNYTRVNQTEGNTWQPQLWRTPYEYKKAHFNEGLKTDNADDKGLYTYGEKELWYTHSIETKSMVATFSLSDRRDARPVADENGGLGNKFGQRKLERIDLYTKAEFLKPNPVPVKTVHFAYSYRLCGNVPNNDGYKEDVDGKNINENKGKLTLEKVWFSYNGNEKQTKNIYKFQYAADKQGISGNPDNNTAAADRWGTYKPNDLNPSSVPNSDFPYTSQELDRATNDALASTWNLEKILLPGGAIINVNYEADDYGYVQNKPAAQMMHVVGFGNDDQTYNDKLYNFDVNKLFHPGEMDNNYVFFEVPEKVNSKEDIMAQYLDGMRHPDGTLQILMKLKVDMPKDSYGEGYEFINVYGTVDDYGTFNDDPNVFWVKLHTSATGGSQAMETVIQFLKDNLPSKAYKGYDIGNQTAIRQIASMVQAMAQAYFQALEGFEYNLKAKSRCRVVDTKNSYVRLDNPLRTKVGGGYRVKSIVINDNWKRISDPDNNVLNPLESTYGQQYDYTTTRMVNGEEQTVSSGVATYEPGIGGEENPFRELLQYTDKQPLGPTNLFNVELPVTEAFFPSPVVGYSKVTVRSIHNSTNKNIKSSTGIQVTQYYTSKDFPVITDYTDFDARSRIRFKPSTPAQILLSRQKDFLTLSQGFRIVLNDMNGKIRSQKSFPENDLKTAINSTYYYYRFSSNSGSTYQLDNNVPVISTSEGIVENKMIGKDVEVMNDMREHYTCTQSIQVPLNNETFSIALIPGLIFTILRALFKAESIYRSATTMKVVTEFGILERVVNFDKGSKVSTDNLVYDAQTGETLISKTNNEFDKPVYHLNYPAHWVNSGMDLAYKNINASYQHINFVNGKIVSPSADIDQTVFESGDELYVVSGFPLAINTIGCVLSGDPLYYLSSRENKIWAIDITKDPTNPPAVHSFIFLDRDGNPYNGNNVYVKIIRSGKRNLVGTSVGSITSMENPVDAVTHTININNVTKVLAASAMEFDDIWRVQDGFYSEYSTQVTDKYVPIETLHLKADKGYSINSYYEHCNSSSCVPRFFHIPNSPDLLARRYEKKDSRLKQLDSRSFLHFNMDDFQNSYTFVSAKLSLWAHTNTSHHGFIYQNPQINNNNPFEDYSHGAVDPYKSTQQSPNNFIITRMLRPWPADNSTDWGNGNDLNTAFWEQNTDYYSLSGGNNAPGNAIKNFILTNTQDNRIDVSGLVQGILRDKNTHGYTPGMRINLINTPARRQQTWVCFNGRTDYDSPLAGKNRSGGGTNSGNFALPSVGEPTLDISYYDCANALPVGSPPPAGPYTICSTSETGMFCYSVFGRTRVNPYVYGVLGNWRPTRAYTYYDKRVNASVSNATSLPTDGVIDNFESFWVTGNQTLQRTNSTKWVWNMETTQYNRKGTEIENRDPLGRYNSGVYGYQETLPIATAGNARVREIAFDGFEDHNYKDQLCEPLCKPYKRHFDIGEPGAALVTTQHHTGKTSLQVDAHSSYTITSTVLADDPVVKPQIVIQEQSSPYTDVHITLAGTGLTGKYYHNANFTGTPVQRSPELPNLYFQAYPLGICAPSSPTPVGCDNISVQWTGSIQTLVAGYYYFSGQSLNNLADDEVKVYVGPGSGTLVAANTVANYNFAIPYYLDKGQAVSIRVTYVQHHGPGYMQLKWRMGNEAFHPIDAINLYPANVTPPVPVSYTAYCVKAGSVQAQAHKFIDGFSMLAGKRYIASAWVKQGTGECYCAAYVDNTIEIEADNISLTGDAKPVGNIIEGWQRYEIDFTLPVNAQVVTIDMKNLTGNPVFFDDLRIHPFNSNLKSFVYNPENLRLSAELDENNYATFYEYDDEGILVRVKKETKDGIKTISETRSAIQKNIQDF